MVRRSLDTKALQKKFQKMRGRSLESLSLPKGITKRRFELFMRVMEAKNSTEIEDIPIEDLASLFVNTEELIAVIYDNSILNKPGELVRSFERRKSQHVRRRIL